MAKKILLIEDDIDTTRLVVYTLEVEGYEVVSAIDGMAGLKKAHSEKPDLIILDVMMLGMDGIEVCRRLRAEPDTADLPILMFSAMARQSDIETGINAGASDYITKPVDPLALVQKVQSLIK